MCNLLRSEVHGSDLVDFCSVDTSVARRVSIVFFLDSLGRDLAILVYYGSGHTLDFFFQLFTAHDHFKYAVKSCV